MAEQIEADGGASVVDLDERRWLPRHCRGDADAFAELIGAYRRPVYSYLVRCGFPSDVRDDLFQEVFLRVHRAAASYQPSRPLKPWLFTIAANTVRGHLRSVQGSPLTTEATAGVRDPAPSAVDWAEAKSTLAWLESAIASLPVSQRDVLLLTCIEEMDQNQVASALGLNVNTVKTHLRRARLTLARLRLARERA